MADTSFYGFDFTSREKWLEQVAKELKSEHPEEDLKKDIDGLKVSAAPLKEQSKTLSAFHNFLAKRKTNWYILGNADDVDTASHLQEWGAQAYIGKTATDLQLDHFNLLDISNTNEQSDSNMVLDGSAFGDAGMSPVEQVSLMLAAGKMYADADQSFLKQARFGFSISPAFLPEIAKLRAFRWLWAKVAGSYSPADPNDVQCKIISRVSPTYYTLYDKENNLLRATTGCMAAALGTSDAIYIPPFDLPQNTRDLSAVRLAINVQHILKEESNIHLVGNPANGSFYLDNLTFLIAEAAWKEFLNIEQNGGFAAMKHDGSLNQLISTGKTDLEKRFADGNLELVGSNLYPDKKARVSKELPQGWEQLVKESFDNHYRVSFNAEQDRLKEEYEQA